MKQAYKETTDLPSWYGKTQLQENKEPQRNQLKEWPTPINGETVDQSIVQDSALSPLIVFVDFIPLHLTHPPTSDCQEQDLSQDFANSLMCMCWIDKKTRAPMEKPSQT